MLDSGAQVCLNWGMQIAEALRATCKEQGLRAEAIGAAVGVSSASVHMWTSRTKPAIPSGEAILRLMREFPSFAERLGFRSIENA